MTVAESSVIELRKKRFKDATLVAGLPGIGFVSKLAVDHLARSLGAQRIATLYSPHFPNQTLALSSGKLKPFTMRFNHSRLKRGGDVVFLRGDLQPLTVEGQYEVASRVLDYAKKIGVKRVVAMAGYAVEKHGKEPAVYCAASSPAVFKYYARKGAKRVPVKAVPIVGMSGLLPALAVANGMEGACLLVETSNGQFDAAGAKRLVGFLGKCFDEKFDASHLDAKVKRLEKAFAEARPQQPAPVAEMPKGDLSYIR